jgi:hypothetical protein
LDLRNGFHPGWNVTEFCMASPNNSTEISILHRKKYKKKDNIDFESNNQLQLHLLL